MISRQKFIYLLFILGLASCARQRINEISTLPDIDKTIAFLASDSLKGRLPGTPEDEILLQFIADEFKKAGLKTPSEGSIQRFEIPGSVTPSEDNSVRSGETLLLQNTDFIPAGWSADAEIEAELLFCGFGMQIVNDTMNWDEYKGVDAKGKWIMLLRGEPRNMEVFLQQGRDRDKVMKAIDKGAAGVILVSGREYDQSDRLDVGGSREPAVKVPVIQIKREQASKLLAHGFQIEELEKRIIKDGPVDAIEGMNPVQAKIRMFRNNLKTGNVTSVLPGSDPALAGEWVVVGAHHDHLGMGGAGSSSRMPDTTAVHYGADDNASGVAVMIDLAGRMQQSGFKPARSILFISFGAEEQGLLGSRYFTQNPPFSLSDVNLMLNLDMVGRMGTDSILQVGGTGTAVELKDILTEKNRNYRFRMSLSEAGYGPSDHAAFYAKDIPVLFFSTGAHSDYHTPNDHPDLLNYSGMEMISAFLFDLIREFSGPSEKLSFREAGPKESTSRSFRGKITLGIMPDVSGEIKDGLPVLAVTKGRPAEQGGMKKGDIITAINGQEIGNVYDYMYKLGTLKAGDRINVRIKRGEDTLELLIQL